MSHEIRTPLNGLLGLAEALESLELSNEQRELVSAILSSGVIVADILSDILDLASMEFGTLHCSTLIVVELGTIRRAGLLISTVCFNSWFGVGGAAIRFI